MEAKSFYCYQRLKDGNQSIGMKSLDYREPYTLTDVFKVIQESKDENDLLSGFSEIIKGDITLEETWEKKISYHIATEKFGTVIMKVRLKKGKENEML